jgi:hypothetical protein
MTLRVVTSDVTIPPSGTVVQDTTSGVGNGGKTTTTVVGAAGVTGTNYTVPGALWKKGSLLDVAVGSALENAIGTANLRAATAADVVGRDGLSN